MPRLFLAVPMPSSPQLVSLIDELRATGEKVKPVDPANLHVTLKFLGDTPDNKVAEVVSAAKDAVNGPPFQVAVKGTGTFGRGTPSVFWAGIVDNGSLRRLADQLDQAMSVLGFERERRTFSAHLTLARAKGGPTRLSEQVIAHHRDGTFAEGIVDRVILFKSDLLPSGPVYTEIASFPLS